MEPSDETLCQRVAGGDEAAFDLLVGRHRERVYRVAWSVLRDAEDARDLSQEAFLRLYRTAGSFAGRARFSTWFYRILLNLCFDHLRRHRWWRRRRSPVPTEDQPPAALAAAAEPPPDPSAALDDRRRAARLWEAVGRLSAQQRAALLLQVQEGFTTAEIAAVLECAEATVRVHLHRAVSRLRQMVEVR